jgi:hypothetical protein
VHQAVERVPVLAQLGKSAADFGIVRDAQGKASLFRISRHLGDAILEAPFCGGEGELGASRRAAFGDAVGNRTLGERPGSGRACPRETHRFGLSWRSRDCSGFPNNHETGYRNRWPVENRDARLRPFLCGFADEP